MHIRRHAPTAPSTARASALSRRRLLQGSAALAAGAAGAATLGSCGTSAAPAGATTIEYWMWDANQLPAYSAAIDLFMEQNPDIFVRVTQLGFDDYWTKLTASFVAEAGPDAFADHLARYPEFLDLGVISPLDGLGALDEIPAERFQEGLQELWTGPDGKRYGLPKDYDTIAVMFDRALLEEEGLAPEDLEGLDWNPQDGGSFEKILARLTLDANGVRGDQEGFDPKNVARYGMAADSGIDYTGQTSWSPFALSTGWTFTDAETWGTHFTYDEERFAATMDWYFGLVDKGFFPPFGMFGDSSPTQTQLQTGKAALALAGSWMITTFDNMEGMDLGIAPLPAGPVGHPVSMFNGLGDSISAQSERKEEAARLIAFLASDEAQQMIGERAPFFPATDVGTQAAIDAYAAEGLDVTPFTERVANGETGLYPLVENSASIMPIMQPAFDQCWMRQIDGADFASYNERVNALFE
ncbi:ABC transporter substrate-binding protein [Brachybacterium sacelli]|uniref:Multiple sugar transport system substrate-binding protein n=1 Tax=Brachybacterium sacelli TaxID=173364 RepID=A0ABS4X044_9MICO|nr:sugar ABC transporter substrate-binding protein [Brachybacterium sacelli]MBP2381823.1 multiple sugar transport system substrate-binding protein [Brachybacterium sacelli]